MKCVCVCVCVSFLLNIVFYLVTQVDKHSSWHFTSNKERYVCHQMESTHWNDEFSLKNL